MHKMTPEILYAHTAVTQHFPTHVKAQLTFLSSVMYGGKYSTRRDETKRRDETRRYDMRGDICCCSCSSFLSFFSFPHLFLTPGFALFVSIFVYGYVFLLYILVCFSIIISLYVYNLYLARALSIALHRARFPQPLLFTFTLTPLLFKASRALVWDCMVKECV